MKTSEKTINKIKEFEGCLLHAYDDGFGNCTIGYGHTGDDVTPDMVISQDRANTLLMQDIEIAENAVDDWDGVYNWAQNEFDALVSFAFNCGGGAVSTLTGYGSRTKEEIANTLPMYCHAGTTVVAGLLARRNWEKALFTNEPAATYISMMTLSRGTCSDLVTIWQVYFDISADGIFGEVTERFVKEFQELHGLDVDGVIGKYTWNVFFQLMESDGFKFS